MLRAPDRFSFFGKLLLCAALLGLPATSPTNAADPAPVATPKPPSVSVTTAESGTLAETILMTGTLVARDEVMVGAEIDGLAITELLAEEGVWIDPKREEHEYGKFAWIKDLEGHRIELWEPKQ